MAYAALLSLSQVLEQTLNHEQYHLLFDKEKLVSLQENVSNMLTFLEDHYLHKEAVNNLERRLIDAAYRAEDIIESTISPLYISTPENTTKFSSVFSSFKNMMRCPQSFFSDLKTQYGGLRKVLKETDSILKEMMRIKNNHIEENIASYSCHDLASVSTLTLKDTDTMVGFDDDFKEIKNRMYQQSHNFIIIPIVGMGGIGKSTLARKIYEDSIRAHHFDRHVWIVVSQEYSRKEILLGVLRSIVQTNDDGKELSKNSDAKLVELIHKELIGRRYLIVLDDVWTTKACDEIYRVFPKNADGSCVLLTTRLSDIATYVASASSPPHTMHLLNEEQSWNLLKERVFGKRACPSQLEKIGKKITRECWGLPLTIVVVAGLLKGNMVEEYWDSMSRNICSREPTISLQCSIVLSLSYDSLPLYLKPCFLYVTVFPENSNINVNRLMRLWMAEGFVRPHGLKCLEEVAREYLEDLVGRNLLLVSKKGSNGRIKTIRIHDLLRDFATIKAQKDSFHYHGLVGTVKRNQRRLSIHSKECLDHIRDLHDPTMRSLLIFWPRNHYSPFPVLKFRLLRILDASTLPLLVKLENLVHLRYLALRYDQCKFSKSMSKLQNLQTLIIYGNSVNSCDGLRLPLEIWKMTSLRHLIMPRRCYLVQPHEYETTEETNLKTLAMATDLEMSRLTIRMIVNVEKLELFHNVQDHRDWEKAQFTNLVHLEKLEQLRITVGIVKNLLRNSVELAFPPSLKKLSLINIALPCWEDINAIIGSLPNLEVLKLEDYVCMKVDWNPNEGEFLKLKHLELTRVPLRNWGVVDSGQFPSLEVVVLTLQRGLRAIPSGFGELNSLKQIVLRYCLPSLVASAKELQANQRNMGNDLDIIVKGLW